MRAHPLPSPSGIHLGGIRMLAGIIPAGCLPLDGRMRMAAMVGPLHALARCGVPPDARPPYRTRPCAGRDPFLADGPAGPRRMEHQGPRLCRMAGHARRRAIGTWCELWSRLRAVSSERPGGQHRRGLPPFRIAGLPLGLDGGQPSPDGPLFGATGLLRYFAANGRVSERPGSKPSGYALVGSGGVWPDQDSGYFRGTLLNHRKSQEAPACGSANLLSYDF